MFADLTGNPAIDEVHARLREIEETRKPRATLIQAYSRQSAKPARDMRKTEIKLWVQTPTRRKILIQRSGTQNNPWIIIASIMGLRSGRDRKSKA
jgi:hypothetical protein